jgi:hypothetical protein
MVRPRMSEESATLRASYARFQITVENRCRLNRSMQRSSNLLIRLSFSKRPDPLGCTQLNLDRAVFSSNQRSRTNSAVETPADWTSGRCCVDPLRPAGLSPTTSFRDWATPNTREAKSPEPSNNMLSSSEAVVVTLPKISNGWDPTGKSPPFVR